MTLILGLLISIVSHAAFVTDFEREVSLHGPMATDAWIEPSEHRPQHAAPIFNKAPPGVYVTSGTERAFMGASLSPNVTHLLVLDKNPRAVVYVRINAALLSLSRDLGDYVNLRLHAPHDAWRARIGWREFAPSTAALLSDPDVFAWFRARVESGSLEYMARRPSHGGMFEGANYLFDEAQYGNLARLARADRIAAVEVDLSQPRQVRPIVRRLVALELPLSIWDSSNLWYSHRLGIDGTWTLAKLVGPAATLDSLFMIVGEDGALGWRYLAASFALLTDPAYFHSLHKLMVDLNREVGLPHPFPSIMSNRVDPPLPLIAQRRTLRLETIVDGDRLILPRRPVLAGLRRACAGALSRAANSISPD